ncbi:5883_t:CDS:2, partial [Acaulospora colombiana]
ASELLQYVPSELKAASLQVQPPHSPAVAPAERLESDLLRTARGFFASKEFARAAYTLRSCKSPKARFLALYTQFLPKRNLKKILKELSVSHWPLVEPFS